MLSNVLSFLVQRSLTAGRRYPTLYRSQVESREDSPVHRGVFVRRALELIEGGGLKSSELSLPRLVSLLRYGRPIPLTGEGGALLALHVEEGSVLDGATVAERVGTEAGATAVAVLREGKMLVPRGPTRFAAGDQLVVVATPEAAEALRTVARALPRP
jgi:hypothetical protein